MKTSIFLFFPLSILVFFTIDVNAPNLRLLKLTNEHTLLTSTRYLFIQENDIGELTANDANQFTGRYEHNYIVTLLWRAFWLKLFIATLVLGSILVLFYLRLNALKRHCVFLEEDVARQTEGLRAANSILMHKHDEMYKQVSKVITQQEQIIKHNFQLEFKADSLRKLGISKDHLIATLIDDLENPVISLAEIADALKEALPRLSKSDMNGFIKTIHACSADIHSTLLNLTNWNQIQSKDIAYRPADFYVSEVIKSIAVSITKQLGQKQFQIDFQVEDDHIIFADYGMINTIFRNLLVNCIKSTENGIVTVTSAETEKQIIVSISCDANKETINQCINVLQDNSQFTNVKFGGPVSSLALTITKEFVRINNGRISIGKRTERELILNIHLPKSVKRIDRGILKIDHKTQTDSLITFEKNENLSILIVDESHEIRDCLRRIFEPTFNVFQASGGREGLAMAIRFKPSIIIAEVTLPDMSGFQLCGTIKRTDSINQIPFIFLTNEWGEESKRQGYLIGASEYMVKPISKDGLLQNVCQIIGEQQKKVKQMLGNSQVIRDEVLSGKTDDEFLNNVVVVIEENLSDPDLDYRRICKQMAMSKSVLYVKFKSITGQSVQEFIKSIRLKKSVGLLLEGSLSINEIALEVGFNSQSYFNKCFHKQYGVGPKAYVSKNGNAAVVDVI
jgi:AraC-like DNA-binding protein/signal transduction histidine kinase